MNARVRIWKPMIEEMYKDLKRTSIGWRAGDGNGAAAEYEQGQYAGSLKMAGKLHGCRNRLLS
jgi:hypothetical protein